MFGNKWINNICCLSTLYIILNLIIQSDFVLLRRMISVQQSKMIFERTIVQAFTVFEQIVARSCAEKRNMVAKR